MPKLLAHLQTIIKGPAKFQIDQYITVWEVAHTRYPPSVVICCQKRGITPQGEPYRKDEKKKKKKKYSGLFSCCFT